MKSLYLGALAALSLTLASPAIAGMPVLGFEVGCGFRGDVARYSGMIAPGVTR